MEDNEIMTTEVTTTEEPTEVYEEKSGMSTGLAMLIGGAIVAGVYAGGKKLKKVWDKHKTKKEAEQTVESEATEVNSTEVEDSDKE